MPKKQPKKSSQRRSARSPRNAVKPPAPRLPAIALENLTAEQAVLVNAIKQGAEFGVTQGGQKFAALLMFITDVHALGLKAAQGLQFTSAFYWDQNDETRAFSQRFIKEVGHMPTMVQAGVYSATLHYLKAVKALGGKEPLKVMENMRQTPINDFMTHNGQLRIDGRVIRDMYLLQVKTPDESKDKWDVFKVTATIPAEQAFRPLGDGGCPLVPKQN